MLDVDEAIFPNNVVKWTAASLVTIDPDVKVFKRALRNTDPRQCVGIHAAAWNPDQESLEMMGHGFPAPQQPSTQQYTFGVQAFVKDSEEERGLAVHSVLSQRVRSVLYTDTNLQVVLANLNVNLPGGWNEAVRKWGIRTARYFSGEIDADLLYLSTLEFWIETETRRTI